jgi:hypothetical protein
MSDPDEAARQAHERAQRAAERAAAARARVQSLQRRRERGASSAQAAQPPRIARAHGDLSEAQKAHDRTDERREREDHT